MPQPKVTHDIVGKPRGKTYRDLIRTAMEYCDSFTLVRHNGHYEATADDMEKRLAPFLIESKRSHEWPGTELIGHEATINRYRLTNESAQALMEVSSLYSWEGPSLPEDLALWSGESCWLGSIAHERDAFMCLTDEQVRFIKKRVPTLKVRKTELHE